MHHPIQGSKNVYFLQYVKAQLVFKTSLSTHYILRVCERLSNVNMVLIVIISHFLSHP
jgi:hypothetical protein